MAGQHQIHAGRGLIHVVARLVIQHDGELVFVQIPRELGHRRAAAPVFRFLRRVLPADQAEAASDGHDFVLQHDYAVFRELRSQLFAGVGTPLALVVVLVVVAEHEVHAAGRFQRSQRFGGGGHVLAGRAFVCEVADEHRHVRLLRLNVREAPGEAVRVEGRAHV